MDPIPDVEDRQRVARLGTPELVRLVLALLAGAAGAIGVQALANRTGPAPIRILPPPPTSIAQPTATPGHIKVYVSGQVMLPSVVELPPGSIVDDAIRTAGGFTIQADTAILNLAQPLVGGAHVYVPALDEQSARPATTVSTPMSTMGSDALPPAGQTGQININLAGQAELETLPGIGPTLARRIVTHREENGPFSTIADLLAVSGIGDAKLSQVEPMITVGGQ
jgi:competence protein ComEA